VAEGSKEQNPANTESNATAPKNKPFWKRCFWWVIFGLKKFDGLITAIATVLLAIITGLLGWVAYWQYQELRNTDKTLQDTMIATSRAWIAPVEIVLTEPISFGKKISFKRLYRNTGHQPAEEVVSNFDQSDRRPAPIERWDLATDPKDWIGQPTCVGLKERQALHPGWPFVYPSDQPIYSENFADVIPTQDIIDGKVVQLVKGCFLYSTMTLKLRHSAFCFYLKASEKSQVDWKFIRCAFGNEGT
jgi:hypothetical protein